MCPRLKKKNSNSFKFTVKNNIARRSKRSKSHRASSKIRERMANSKRMKRLKEKSIDQKLASLKEKEDTFNQPLFSNTQKEPEDEGMSDFAKFIAFDLKKCEDEVDGNTGTKTGEVKSYLNEDDDDSFLKSKSFIPRETTPEPTPYKKEDLDQTLR